MLPAATQLRPTLPLAIDVILAVWERNPPYDIDFPDNRFKVSFAHTAALELGVGILELA